MNPFGGLPIERASAADLLALAADLPGAPAVIAAVIVLGPGASDLTTARTEIGDRILAVPRLRQRLMPTPFACGRKVWVDDDHFDIRNHVTAVDCPSPGDESALLDVAAEYVTRRLPACRPLWSAQLVTGLADEGTALIFAFHHVLADGIGGLAILARLVDGAPSSPLRDFPRPAPGKRRLFLEALQARLRATTAVTAGLRRLRSAVREGAPRGIARTPRTSLNRPIGSGRRFAVARADLRCIQQTAHAHSATVNDVVLSAVAGALHAVLQQRNESVDQIVASMPVSGRRFAGASHLGNQVGAIPIELPCIGDPLRRLSLITVATRAARSSAPGSSAALLAPAFRGLAAVGLLKWFVDRQHLVTTFVTNVRGPATQLRIVGAAITGMIPVSPLTGNVTVAFAALSYAGTLVVTVVADPHLCPELPLIATALQRELDVVTVPVDVV